MTTLLIKGCPVCILNHTCYVSCGKWQPTNANLCVTGGQNLLQAWDIRTPDVPVRQYQYKDDFGQVMNNLSIVLTFCHWHLSPKPQLISLKHHRHIKLKMHENIEKINFIKIVFGSFSINRDMVLEWKLGQLVWTDLLLLKRISLSSTPPSFGSTVITLSGDIVHKFEKLTFAGKK